MAKRKFSFPTEKQNETFLKTSEYKDATNCWIDPDGNFFRTGYMAHNQWATEYLQQFWDVDFFDLRKKLEKEHRWGGYAYEYLNKKGWFRLLTWNSSSTRVVGYSGQDRPNKEQSDALYLWCSYNNTDYETLFLP